MAQKINSKQNGGFWEELGRASVNAGTSAQLTVNFTAKKHLRIIFVQHSGGVGLTSGIRFNNDSGTNYAYRTNENGVESSATNQTWMQTGVNSLEGMSVEYQMVNEAAYRKVATGLETFWDTAGNIYRNTYAGYWQNSSVQVNRIDAIATAGAFRPGSELIVLGHD